jgi:hypothetical protein
VSGRLDLATPWARTGLQGADREDVIAAIPDGVILFVSVSPNRGAWIFRMTNALNGAAGGPLRVSASMSLRTACFYALRHFGERAA